MVLVIVMGDWRLGRVSRRLLKLMVAVKIRHSLVGDLARLMLNPE
jgi:hypothetical protein